MLTKRRIIIILTTYSTMFIFSVLIAMMFSYSPEYGFEPIPFMLASSVIIFTLAFYAAGKISDYWHSYMNKKDLVSGLTHTVTSFVNDVRNSYSMDEIVFSIQNTLEKQGDCSIILIDTKNEYVIYNSPSIITQDEKVFDELRRNFARFTTDGYHFFDSNLGLLSESDNSRGFFISFDTIRLFVFCNSTRIFAPIIFDILYEELKKFYKRFNTISSLTGIDELSQEWSMIADTQKSFLPKKIPSVANLDIAVFFKPLINVSGDYYTVIEISKTKTLVLLGDVSGKGFSAALIMGIVINIVKTYADKTDLVNLVRTIDKMIKAMHFEDKYTVLFVGLIDTESMRLSYINASVADACVLTQNPAGYKVKHIPSNCSIVGLVDIGEIEVISVPLFWNDVLFFATDGLGECTDEQGVDFASSNVFNTKIKSLANSNAQSIVTGIHNLALSYGNNAQFKDDITVLAIKVEK